MKLVNFIKKSISFLSNAFELYFVDDNSKNSFKNIKNGYNFREY